MNEAGSARPDLPKRKQQQQEADVQRYPNDGSETPVLPEQYRQKTG
ncbi:MAG: hypothetical protein HOE30_10885 [Deltaproteobacteria bacterium]|nr:hypothetical protein [Deltaproteobacteria bacterium]MBT4264258.1 hypothetical protein [Deltaproteobacteria bacterium]MBT4638716.1 hypothetical protein [Deltaproteobacteria bacterium]MBT6503609.1 hypothetical protein [Deltaproteobacteria bacterium]MBT7151078.1 hypothetical protein [Deltaproteobacteria bacterium]